MIQSLLNLSPEQTVLLIGVLAGFNVGYFVATLMWAVFAALGPRPARKR